MEHQTEEKAKVSLAYSKPDIHSNSKLKRSVFTYEWKVEDFGLFMDRSYEIPSPMFGQFQSQWRLVLLAKHEYPKGPVLCVCLISMSQDSELRMVKYKVCALSKKGITIYFPSKQKIFRKYQDFDESGSISHAELVENRVIDANNLTIRCEIEELLVENNDQHQNKSVRLSSTKDLSDKDINNFSRSFSTPVATRNTVSSEMKLNNLDVFSVPNINSNFNIDGSHGGKTFSRPAEYKLQSLDKEYNTLQCLSNDFCALYANNFCSDLTLTTDDGHNMSVHKAVLWARSDYFKNLTTAGKGSTSITKIRIPDIKSTVLEAILYYLYTGKNRTLTLDFSLELLSAAKNFRLENFQELLENDIKNKINSDNIVQVLKVAKDLNRESLKQFCIEYVHVYKEEVVGSVNWKRMIESSPNIATEVKLTLANYGDII